MAIANYSYVRPDIQGGCPVARSVSLLATGVIVKASLGQVYGWHLYNDGAAAVYVKLYNKATAPVVGTDVPLLTIAVPTKGVAQVNHAQGIPFSLGIGWAATTVAADNDATAPAAAQVVANLFYS